MLRRWLRSRTGAQPRSAVLQSSAAGLIHFPTLTIPPPTASGASGSGWSSLSGQRVIVVGVTHERAARNALRWAYQRAVADDATLVVVTAFEPPCPALTVYGWALIDARDAAVAAKFMQDNVLRDELRSEQRGTRVRAVITRGDPAKVLVEAARNAELLVIGRRTGRLRRLASRSISRRCASHVECPLVVVRGDVSVGRRYGSPRRRVLAPAARHADHTRAHPQFEFRRHAH